MALHYTHSHLFQNLKQIQESIKENYSSAQYINVLDKLLFRALKPVIFNTNFLNAYLVELLHLSIINHRRKISNLSKEKFITYVFLFLVSDKETQFKLIRKMKLERTFINFVLNRFLSNLSEYYDTLLLCSKNDLEAQIKKSYLESQVKFLSNTSLHNLYKECEEQLGLSRSFKKKIVEKYVRHIINAAQSHYKMNDSKMELDEIIQTMFVYGSHAIDKYDQNKGTLTSYITTWLQHARNQSSVNELETSFLLPHSKRSEIRNASVPLETIENMEAEETEINDDIIRVRQLAKIADPKGFARIAMEIQEYLTREEIMLQKESTF